MRINFHNKTVQQFHLGKPEVIIDEGLTSEGTRWIEATRAIPPSRPPMLLDNDEITKIALGRVQNALRIQQARSLLDVEKEDEEKHKVDERQFNLSWQKKQVRKENRQDIDMWYAAAGQIGSGGHHVIHPVLIHDRALQKKNWMQFGESTELSNGDKKILLSDIMKKQIEYRKSELFAMAKGIQNQAESDGLEWGMLTLTCPPKFHSNPTRGKNSWDGSTPTAAHKFLHNNWRGVLRRLANDDITISGVRVTEFHKDGCPHWHIIFYCQRADFKSLLTEVRKTWKDERAADFVMGDPAKSSFSSYAFKYILKTLNSDEANPTAMAYDAKRAIWHQRGMQFFGVPSLGIWRAARAMSEAPADQLSASVWRAAKRGDGSAFIGLCGGLGVASKHRPIHGKIKSTPAHIQFGEVMQASKFAILETENSRTIIDLPTWKKSRLALMQNYPREAKLEKPESEYFVHVAHLHKPPPDPFVFVANIH